MRYIVAYGLTTNLISFSIRLDNLVDLLTVPSKSSACIQRLTLIAMLIFHLVSEKSNAIIIALIA